ncbi:hypothetical protein NQ315_003129 [Exocentrus adspersus]|uniref:Uncharacterized protein n=1 Tax=Exocentrus adspersus TaxID=1586481 RepID=A0AAV8W4H3_9CUCU|nr:hypothetical protein NQ315_003129 [Exocentrus adspersus]
MNSSTIFFLIVYLNCNLTHCDTSDLFSRERDIRTSLSQCIIQACKRFFTSNFGTVTYSLPLVEVNKSLVSATLLNQLVLPVLQAEQLWSMLVVNVKRPELVPVEHPRKSLSYIIQIREENEFARNIKKLENSKRWNPHARFLVVSPTVFQNPSTVAMEIIKSLWYHNVVDAAVLLADTNNNTNFHVYSWKPYNRFSCGDNFQDLAPVDACSFGVTTTTTRMSWFGEKIPSQLYKCPIRVKYIVWPPFVMDTKPTAQVSHLPSELGGNVDEDFSATKDLKLLKENKVDVVVGGYVKTGHRILFFDASQTYMQESLVWCVPHQPVSKNFKNMLNILQTEVWEVVFVLYLITSICMWFVSVYNVKELRYYKFIQNCLLGNYSVLIGGCVNALPKTPQVRYFIGILILLSLKLNILYNSYFTSILSLPHYEEKFGEMEQIYRHNLKTYFLPQYKPFFDAVGDQSKQINNVPLGLINMNWRNCTHIPTCLGFVITKKDSAICLPRMYKDYLKTNHTWEHFKAIYCSDQNVVTFPMNFLMRKGFPLYKLFDGVIRKIISAGFIYKWKQDALTDECNDNHREALEVREVDIKFSNLVPVFYMMGIGYAVATLAFIGEVVLGRKEEGDKSVML